MSVRFTPSTGGRSFVPPFSVNYCKFYLHLVIDVSSLPGSLGGRGEAKQKLWSTRGLSPGVLALAESLRAIPDHTNRVNK